MGQSRMSLAWLRGPLNLPSFQRKLESIATFHGAHEQITVVPSFTRATRSAFGRASLFARGARSPQDEESPECTLESAPFASDTVLPSQDDSNPSRNSDPGNSES